MGDQPCRTKCSAEGGTVLACLTQELRFTFIRFFDSSYAYTEPYEISEDSQTTNPGGLWTFQNGLVFEPTTFVGGLSSGGARPYNRLRGLPACKADEGTENTRTCGSEAMKACPYYVSTTAGQAIKCTHCTPNIQGVL